MNNLALYPPKICYRREKQCSAEAHRVYLRAGTTPITGVAAAPCGAQRQLAGGVGRREPESLMSKSD